MRSVSSFRKKAAEKLTSSSAGSGEAESSREKSTISAGWRNIPGSSAIAGTFGSHVTRFAPAQPEPAGPPTDQAPPHDPFASSTSFTPPPLGQLDVSPKTTDHQDAPVVPTATLPALPSDRVPDASLPSNTYGITVSAEIASTSLHQEPSSGIPVQSSRPKPESKSSGFRLPWEKNKDLEESASPQNRAEPQFKIKIPKQLRGVANLSELEVDLTGGDISIVSDTKKKERKEGLCTACSKINFEQFDSRTTSAGKTEEGKFTRKLIFLDRILRKQKRRSCNFCCLIFDAIAENDPFQHPAVKDHLPPELAGMNFRKWAEDLNWTQHVPVYKAAYPFGRSRDNVDLRQEVQGEEVVVQGSTDNDELAPDDAAKVGSAAAVAALNVGIWTETDTERIKIMATVGTVIPTLTSLMTSLDAKLPVAISVIIHNAGNADSGLLNVDVWGYGNAHRAPLSRISTFNLRIASSYRILDGHLSYGKLLRPEIDVEADCKMWLENCSEHHGQSCEQPSWWNELQPPSGPHFRLIDVNQVRIVQKDMSGPDKPRYAALSYVWGAAGRQCLNLHVRNLDDLSSHLEGQPLPMAKTIRDAIEVTRRMGLQYLWVDSLCIIQHDGRGEDNADARAQQIQQMDRIFGHATVTIVSADGLDAEAGLSGISSPAIRSQIAREIQPNVNVLLAVQYSKTYGKWDTRAWTFQEKLLSKRILMFNSGCVSFHCRHGVLREDMPASHAGNGPAQIPWLSLPQNRSGSMIRHAWDGSPVLLRSPFFSEYANLLVQYTSRDMSDSRDALNAILGLLKVLEKMTNPGQKADPEEQMPTDYTLHGLPEKFLDLALLWQPPAAKGVHLTKRPQDDLPSWSWTGWEVSKDPDFDHATAVAYHVKPGVRFEEPFWVSTNDDLSLKKVVARANDSKKPAEERFKPLVMWYKCLGPPLPGVTQQGSQNNPTRGDAETRPVPVNGHGLGLALGPTNAKELCKFQEDAIRLRSMGKQNMPIDAGPPCISTDVPLDNRHLICETQVARFRLRRTSHRKETLWTRSAKGLVIDTELTIPEAEVINASDEVVGRVIPTDQRKGLSSGFYDFILLSESQYWGDEENVEGPGLPLFNVMVVEWDTRREFAVRVGLGKVRKTGWWAAQPTMEIVILK